MSARFRRSPLQVTPLEARVNPSTFTWDGGGADDNWSTAANWLADVAPTAADVDTVVVFNTVDSNVVMDVVGMDVARIQFDAGSDVTLVLNTNLILDGAGAAVTIEDNTASTNVIAGPGSLVLTNADAVFEHDSFPGFLTISAPIAGLRGFTKTGLGTVILSTSAGNIYAGTTTVADGVLELRTDTFTLGLSSTIIVGDGVGAAGSAVLRFGPSNNFELRSNTTLTVNGDGRVRLPTGTIDLLTSLNIDGGELITAGTLQLQSGGIVSSDGTAGSEINGPGTLQSLGVRFRFDVADGPGATDLLVSTSLSQLDLPATLVKTGTGTLEFAMTAANTLTGETLVRDGALLLNTTTTDAALSGAITVGDAIGTAGSAVLRLVNSSEVADAAGIRVNADGRLDVTATASEIVASLNLNLAPGGGGFAIATGGVFQVLPAGPLDTIDLTGGVLTFNRTGPLVPFGQPVTLIDNLGADAVIGTFAGLPEGATVTANGQAFTISYVGGDGNDVVLTADNTPPVAVADTLTTSQDVAGTIDPRGNDTDANGDTLMVTAVTQGANGAVTFTPTGVTYTPAAGFSGSDSFTYTVSDGNGETATATVSVTVTPDNDPPTTSSVLAVSGPADGKAQLFTPNAAGLYGATPVTVSALNSFGGTVRTAVADVNGDGTDDTVLVTGPGGPVRVVVVSGVDNTTVLVAPFDPFQDPNFTGGGFVAAADIDGDGKAEFVVTPDEGGGPRVSIFTRNADATTTRVANFLGIDDANFRGGARAALGDVDADGTPDLIVCAGFLGGPRTAVFEGTTLFGAPARLVNDFFAFPGTDATTLRNGVFVAAGDVDGDGFAELIFGGGPGGAPRVFVLSGALASAGDVGGAQAAPLANFFVAGNASDRGGVRVATKAADGDARADVVTGSGEGSPANVRVYLGANFAGGGEPGTFQDISVFGGAALPGGVFVG